jgi:hypothetical protein
MTSTTGDSTAGRRLHPRIKAIADWAGHHWIAFVLIGIAAGPFLDLLPRQSWFVTRTVALTISALVLLLGLRHDAQLCERCAVRMPLDGNAAAARNARRLRLVHIPPLWFAFTSALIPASFLLHGWAAFAGELAVMPLPIYAWASARIHRQLKPWCPRCNWGDGGDGPREPSPDPSIDTPSPQPA